MPNIFEKFSCPVPSYERCRIIFLLYCILIASLQPNVTLRWNSTGITIAGTMGVCGQTAAYLCNPHGLSFDPLSNAL
ncbi:unnamed protein product, partial [Rotaria sordida]